MGSACPAQRRCGTPFVTAIVTMRSPLFDLTKQGFGLCVFNTKRTIILFLFLLISGSMSGGGFGRRDDCFDREIPHAYSPITGKIGSICIKTVADGVGFEPTGRVNTRRFSRPVLSTTQPPIRGQRHIVSDIRNKYI